MTHFNIDDNIINFSSENVKIHFISKVTKHKRKIHVYQFTKVACLLAFVSLLSIFSTNILANNKTSLLNVVFPGEDTITENKWYYENELEDPISVDVGKYNVNILSCILDNYVQSGYIYFSASHTDSSNIDITELISDTGLFVMPGSDMKGSFEWIVDYENSTNSIIYAVISFQYQSKSIDENRDSINLSVIDYSNSNCIFKPVSIPCSSTVHGYHWEFTNSAGNTEYINLSCLGISFNVYNDYTDSIPFQIYDKNNNLICSSSYTDYNYCGIEDHMPDRSIDNYTDFHNYYLFSNIIDLDNASKVVIGDQEFNISDATLH